MAVNSDAAIPWPYSRPHDMPWDTEAGAGCLEWARACAIYVAWDYALRASLYRYRGQVIPPQPGDVTAAARWLSID